MKVVILGSGAMGTLFGSYLSKNNDVTLVDVSETIVNAILENGVKIKEKDGSISKYKPKATTKCTDNQAADLIVVFVKAMFSESALNGNKQLIGPDTYLMTLQNGAGHESTLLKFADRNHVIIGSTQHNSSIIEPGFINHGGSGLTSIGLLSGNNDFVKDLAANFTSCDLQCNTSDNIQWQIWHKLFTNTAASSLTGILQVSLGFIGTDKYANSLMHKLVHEAVQVANALGLEFKEEDIVKEVQQVCDNAPNGFTSIYADLRDGRKTEVDTISGSVVQTAKNLGINVPYHEMVVEIIHAFENKK